MTMRLLWFVLAGFLLGFAASTLWEWLHFRRERMKLRDERVRELEGQVREQKKLMDEMRPVAVRTPAWDQPAYHSPGVFLESEELELESDELEGEVAVAARSPNRAADSGGFDEIRAARAAPARPIAAAASAPAQEAGAERDEPTKRTSESLEQLAASLSSRYAAAEAAPDRDYRSDYLERSSNYPDDLTKIKGIGDVYRWRLYRAGIYTWHQIAESAEETLRAATNAYPGSNIGDWQEQARQLAQKNGRQGAVYDGPSPDDLTKIIGIGPVGARTLFRAGICTYEQLAGATPAELHDLFPIAVAGDEPNFEHWVAQAADLAGRKTAK
ncbi:MAG: helix-hairpin-helix domain-containing protein [Chloroflexota bacterium]|jgi:predicted flap endonuclease-1-like 5' DNA nuclease|nr:helix-hairpin-helix domain-containing protein [Chloroflexota bacterium]